MAVYAIDVPTVINQPGTDLNASTASSAVTGGLQVGPETHTCTNTHTEIKVQIIQGFPG